MEFVSVCLLRYKTVAELREIDSFTSSGRLTYRTSYLSASASLQIIIGVTKTLLRFILLAGWRVSPELVAYVFEINQIISLSLSCHTKTVKLFRTGYYNRLDSEYVTMFGTAEMLLVCNDFQPYIYARNNICY